MQRQIEILQKIETSWDIHTDFALWLIERTQPQVVVDLGVDYGFSSFIFALGGAGHVYGVDAFQDRSTKQQVLDTQQQLGVQNLTVIEGFFSDVVKDWSLPIDILHIDGMHDYDSVKEDYTNWSRFVRDTGVILMHDISVKEFGVFQFFEEIALPKMVFTDSFGLGVITKNQKLIEDIIHEFQTDG